MPINIKRAVVTAAAGVGIAFALATASKALDVPGGATVTDTIRPAAAFIDSIGVNVHFSYHDGPYGKVGPTLALIRSLGVKHVRDGVSLGQTDVCQMDRTLASAGVRFDYIVAAALGQPQLIQWAGCVGPAIESYEGLNEYDISHPGSDANWVATDRRVQSLLYQNVKSAPALAKLTVIGPSLTSEGAYRAVGDLSASMDVGNMHNYFAGHEPGTGGWGLGGYGSIPWNLAAARIVAGAKPIDTTETGYSSGPDPKAVDASTQAAYVPILFLEQFNAGVLRTYYYELLDEGGAPFSHYGLADATLQPKPAFTALAAMIALLNDGSTAAAADGHPSSFRYGLDDASNVHHLVVQKRDGTLFVILWQSVASYDVGRGAPIAVDDRAVTLRLPQRRYRKATIFTFDASGRLRPADVTGSMPAIALHLGKMPEILQLSPGS